MIRVKTFTFNAFQENTYVVSCDGACMIIDPGNSDQTENNKLKEYLDASGLKPTLLMNTHCHIDHVLGNDWVKNTFQIPFLIHEKELPVLHSVKAYAPNYGYPTYCEATPDRFVQTGETIMFGSSSFQILFVPGHAPGHIGLYFKEEKKLFAGDVLFRESIGRTDLPGGDFNTLISSIKSEIFSLPEDVQVFPGHGIPTTVGYEKLYNPFCAEHLINSAGS
jgi:glyoxylase-like metal-dependent hydrolase (beta-lactamase superfamily II)